MSFIEVTDSTLPTREHIDPDHNPIHTSDKGSVMSFSTLVSARQLLEHLSDPGWLIVDVRHDLNAPEAGIEGWKQGHIPGARFLHMDHDLSSEKTGLNGRHPLPKREVFVETMQALGLHAATQVVVYDAQEGMMAARLWWMLRWIGHENIAVLDGGLSAWQDIQAKLETLEPPGNPSGSIALGNSLAPTLDAARIMQNLGTHDYLVVDARAPDRFRGENETMDPIGGHIPYAINRFFRDNLQTTGQFKPADQLRSEWLKLLSGHAVSKVVAQCGSGVTACHNLLALEVAGLPGASLYPGSWSEWCADPAHPVATGA